MKQAARLIVVVTLALVTVALMIPSSSQAQNGTRRQRRNALRASRPYAPVALGTNGAGRAPANPADVQAVTQAYRLLSQADHDYQGHRAKAMKHLHQAGRVLGVSLKGDGKAKEDQGSSDTQLKQAQTTLQQMTGNNAAGKRHQRAMQHVNSALSEISTALSIK
ncbi:MAG TPA: hypothetical protein VGP63_07580 [Planctomycetaceae bacterium]|jgi:hypothetical protein|nr:hypothetical protein [Planctomycetaceae bacterium]